MDHPCSLSPLRRVLTVSSLLLAVIALGHASSARSAAPLDPKGVEFFEKKIRPVLVEKCYTCHSLEARKNQKLRGGLLLDSRETMRKGGDSGSIIVPGKPNESLLLHALKHESLKMPPKGKLADEVVADFARWIEMGAPDPREAATQTAQRVIDVETGKKYWAFQPLLPGPPPMVTNAAWARTPIDRFILAKLEEKKLTPSPALNRERLLRRAYYDVLGLPPTPAEIDAFVKDVAPDAYDRLIDRLLQSERYGERWARHWLDTVRYAESGGYEFDKDRPGAYYYRDFVIKALNQDMPYDEFVRLQIAGDQLHPGELSPTAATGFLVAGPFPGQTTVKTREPIRYDHLDDMLATLGTSMLGLSLGCARCHDHKYDPILQQDYYHLLACLARTDSTDAKIDTDLTATRKAKADFDQAHAPLAAARDRFEKEELPARLLKWLEAQKSNAAPTWSVLDAVSATGKASLKKLDDGSHLATGKAEKSDVYAFTAHTHQKAIVALRLDALADNTLPQSGPGRGAEGSFSLTEITVVAAPLSSTGKPAKPVTVKLKPMATTAEAAGQTLAGAVDADKKTGWSIMGAGKSQSAVFALESPIGFDGGTLLTITLKFENDQFAIGRPRLAIATAKDATIDSAAALQNAVELRTALHAGQGKLSAANRDAVLRWYRTLDAQANQTYDAVEQHAKKEPQPKLVNVFAASSGKGGDVHFLIRGEVDRKNGVMAPGFMQVMMNAADKEQRWLGATTKGKPSTEPRVGMAKWITDTEAGAGRLLARVIVNRLWQHHLGKGIVRTPNDFGSQGEPPTHPELLDFLASELIRNGWKLKPLHKMIMTSAVYMQSGVTNGPGFQADPQNRLWQRVPPRRLEAESIRDALLAVSGTLDAAMYGPGTLDENNARRSIYLTVKRSRLVPLMQMFDSPEPIQSIGERQTTTVATQALAMLNSPMVRQRAEKLALRIRPKSPDDLPQAVDAAYLYTLSRRPSPSERERMLSYIRGQQSGADAKTLDTALADFCQVMLCLNEFVYID